MPEAGTSVSEEFPAAVPDPGRPDDGQLADPDTGPGDGQLAEPDTGPDDGQLAEPDTGQDDSQLVEPDTGQGDGQLAEPGTGPDDGQLAAPDAGQDDGQLAEPDTGQGDAQLAAPDTGQLAGQSAVPDAGLQVSQPAVTDTGPPAEPETSQGGWSRVRRAFVRPRQHEPETSQGGGWSRVRRAFVRPPQDLLALLLYGGLSLEMFGRWILDRMSTYFLSGQPQDGSLFLWAFRWWPYAVSHHLSAFFSYAAWAPGGINLTWATTVPLPAIVLQGLTHSYGPFFTFNVIELAAPALAAWTAYLLCRRITGSFVPALIGGFFFGFSPALIDEVGQGHPSLTLVFLIPVCAYLLLRLLEGSIHPLWYVQLLGITLAVQLYIGEEIFATMTLVGLICALIGFAAGPAERRRRLVRAIAPTAGAYVVAAVLASPLLYTTFTRTRIVKAIHFATIEYGAASTGAFLRFVTPGRYTNHWGLFVARWGDNPWYLGIPLIVVVILFVITDWRRRTTWALLTGLIVILAFSLGDLMSVFGAQIMPWRLIAGLPVLNVAQPGRLLTYFYLLIAVLVARWLTWIRRPPPEPSPYPPSSPLWRPTPRRPHPLYPLRYLLVVLAGVTILPAFSSDVWAVNVRVPAFLASGAYRHVLSPGEIVWVVDSHADRQLVWQAQTGFYFRLAGGFFGGTPQGVRDAQVVERLAIGQIEPGTSVAEIRDYLAAHRVGAILVAEAPWPSVLELRQATGHWGYYTQQVRLFRLGNRFTDPALAHQPIRQIGSNKLAHHHARKPGRQPRPTGRLRPGHRTQRAHQTRPARRTRHAHRSSR